MSKTSPLAAVRFNRNSAFRWWQIRPIDFSLLLFPLIIQRILVLPLWILAMTYSDGGDIPLSLALDTSYLGMNGPKSLFKIIALGWILLVVATATAFIEKCYSLKKAILVFGGIALLMLDLSLKTIDLFSPYLQTLL